MQPKMEQMSFFMQTIILSFWQIRIIQMMYFFHNFEQILKYIKLKLGLWQRIPLLPNV